MQQFSALERFVARLATTPPTLPVVRLVGRGVMHKVCMTGILYVVSK